MRWETDKRWLYEGYSDYTTIEYQIFIDEKAIVIEIKTFKNAPIIVDLQCFSHKIADFATFTSEVCRLIRYEEKLEKIENKLYS